MERNAEIMRNAQEKSAIQQKETTEQLYIKQEEAREQDYTRRKGLQEAAEQDALRNKKGMKEKRINLEEAQLRRGEEIAAKLIDPNDGPLVTEMRASQNQKIYDRAKNDSLEDLARSWWRQKQNLIECTGKPHNMQLGMIISKGVTEYYNGCSFINDDTRILEALILDTNRQVFEVWRPPNHPHYSPKMASVPHSCRNDPNIPVRACDALERTATMRNNAEGARVEKESKRIADKNAFKVARENEIRERVKGGLEPGPRPSTLSIDYDY